ncbi:MAG: phage tail sheath C-terminal domain-containing protein, partial [Oscillospiraceae bacterium]
AQELEHRTYKAIVYNQTALDNRHIVNFANEKVTFKDSRATPIQAGVEYLPSLLGILASCNVERGVTNFVCKNLVEVKETIDIDKDINAGNFLLLNEFSDVRVAVGINSKTSIAEGESEDMKYIDIIETMDLIADDIRNTFKEQYQGRYKNKLDYQMLFISAVNTYFKALELNDVLDNMYSNIANVDVNAQRKAWAAIKPEAEFWDDTKVRNTSYKRNVYLAGDIKILGAMESLQFNISIF